MNLFYLVLADLGGSVRTDLGELLLLTVEHYRAFLGCEQSALSAVIPSKCPRRVKDL
jgi:hypothetical protein